LADKAQHFINQLVLRCALQVNNEHVHAAAPLMTPRM
jgi:hypothetical protein